MHLTTSSTPSTVHSRLCNKTWDLASGQVFFLPVAGDWCKEHYGDREVHPLTRSNCSDLPLCDERRRMNHRDWNERTPGTDPTCRRSPGVEVDCIRSRTGLGPDILFKPKSIGLIMLGQFCYSIY